jgi:hypothetical protein
MGKPADQCDDKRSDGRYYEEWRDICILVTCSHGQLRNGGGPWEVGENAAGADSNASPAEATEIRCPIGRLGNSLPYSSPFIMANGKEFICLHRYRKLPRRHWKKLGLTLVLAHALAPRLRRRGLRLSAEIKNARSQRIKEHRVTARCAGDGENREDPLLAKGDSTVIKRAHFKDMPNRP